MASRYRRARNLAITSLRIVQPQWIKICAMIALGRCDSFPMCLRRSIDRRFIALRGLAAELQRVQPRIQPAERH